MEPGGTRTFNTCVETDAKTKTKAHLSIQHSKQTDTKTKTLVHTTLQTNKQTNEQTTPDTYQVKA